MSDPEPTSDARTAGEPSGCECGRNSSRGIIAVAIIGFIATVGSSALVSNLSYQTAKDTVSSERWAQLEDQRRATYSDFLRSVATLCDAYEGPELAQQKGIPVTSEIINQQSRMLLVAGPQMRDPVQKFIDYIRQIDRADPKHPHCDDVQFNALRSAFLNAAKTDLPEIG